jgi:hypothetical protein
MKVTEEEAKTKWCPFVQISSGSDSIASNRSYYLNNCIASGCMKWELTESKYNKGYCNA